MIGTDTPKTALAAGGRPEEKDLQLAAVVCRLAFSFPALPAILIYSDLQRKSLCRMLRAHEQSCICRDTFTYGYLGISLRFDGEGLSCLNNNDVKQENWSCLCRLPTHQTLTPLFKKSGASIWQRRKSKFQGEL